MPGIFVSYRREDSAGHVGRLCDNLNKHFGPANVFKDIDTIGPGMDFVEQIEKGVGSCSVLLAVIGPSWLSASDKHGRRRLDNPQDFIRREITVALSRSIRVIPVLVEGASMPLAEELPQDLGSLARRNAHEISDLRWDFDVGRLISALEKIPDLVGETTPTPPPPRWGKLALVAGGLLSASLVIALVIYHPQQPNPPSGQTEAEEQRDRPDKDARVENITEKPAGETLAPIRCDIAGSWKHSTEDVGEALWIVNSMRDDRYHAQEVGLGNASGTAVLDGNRLEIDWTTPDSFSGRYEWELAPNCLSGIGRLTFFSGATGIHKSSITRTK